MMARPLITLLPQIKSSGLEAEAEGIANSQRQGLRKEKPTTRIRITPQTSATVDYLLDQADSAAATVTSTLPDRPSDRPATLPLRQRAIDEIRFLGKKEAERKREHGWRWYAKRPDPTRAERSGIRR